MRNYIFVCSLLFAAVPASAGELANRLIRDTGQYDLHYSDNPVVVIETERYTLFFQREPGCPLGVDTIMDWLDTGIERVEYELNAPVGRKFYVFLPQSIVPQQGGGNCIGLRFDVEERNCIALKREAASVGLIVHEVVHEWFKAHSDQECESWSLEEGIAEYREHPGRFHPSRWSVLVNNGPLTQGEVAIAAKSSDESQVRATRWLQVYWLRHVHPKRFSLLEIARFKEEDLPDPNLAFKDLKALEARVFENERRERETL